MGIAVLGVFIMGVGFGINVKNIHTQENGISNKTTDVLSDTAEPISQIQNISISNAIKTPIQQNITMQASSSTNQAGVIIQPKNNFPKQSVIADGSPIMIEFDATGSTISTISIKRNTAQTIILRALFTTPAEGIDFLNMQGTYIGLIRPGESKTIMITPSRSSFLWPHTQDHKTRYPYTIGINIY